MLTFPTHLFTNKIWRKKKISGVPHFGPLKSEASQKLPSMGTYNPWILFYYKNGDVCKKLDLNILKIDWAIAILGLKKKIEFFLLKFLENFPGSNRVNRNNTHFPQLKQIL